jgi:G:T/U-mismatch repair DNA glycosylase
MEKRGEKKEIDNIMSFAPPNAVAVSTVPTVPSRKRDKKRSKRKIKKKSKRNKKEAIATQGPQFDPMKQCFFCQKAKKKCHCKQSKKQQKMFDMFGISLQPGGSNKKTKRKHKHRKDRMEPNISEEEPIQTRNLVNNPNNPNPRNQGEGYFVPQAANSV